MKKVQRPKVCGLESGLIILILNDSLKYDLDPLVIMSERSV